MEETKAKTASVDADTLPIRVFAIVLLLLLGAVCGNCWGSMLSPNRAAAQHPELSASLALARLCVNESGLRAYTLGDCAAIHAVISFRAEHIYHSSYVDALHRYSHGMVASAAQRRQRTDARMWITQLHADLREPAWWNPNAGHWLPRNGRSGDRRRWQLSLQHACDVYSGSVVAECYAAGTAERERLMPHTWAAPRVRHDHLTEIDCSGSSERTVNVFWSVPRYAARWPADAS